MPTLDTIKYASLLTGYGYSPKVIEGEADYEQAKATLEGLLFPERKLLCYCFFVELLRRFDLMHNSNYQILDCVAPLLAANDLPSFTIIPLAM